MSKKAGIFFVIAGAVLILSALLLFLYNANEDDRAGEQAEALLEEVRAEMEEAPVEDDNPEMTVVEIGGYGYIGYLSIPKLEVDLPVMADWDYNRLQLAPCRQFGSTKTDDLVIAAHNYNSHFGALSTLETGDEVLFTDMNRRVSRYAVDRVETLEATAVDAVQNSGHDLVLYTCTYGGRTRVVAFCDR